MKSAAPQVNFVGELSYNNGMDQNVKAITSMNVTQNMKKKTQTYVVKKALSKSQMTKNLIAKNATFSNDNTSKSRVGPLNQNFAGAVTDISMK